MKRKGILILGQRNMVVVLLALMLIISSVLTACGTSTEIKEEGVSVEKEEVVQVDVEETTQEEDVENIEGVVEPQSVFEWSAFIDASIPILTIWNDVTKEGTVIENGQKCIWKEGDLLVVCMQEKESNIEFLSPVKCRAYGSSTEKVLEFQQEFFEETLYEFVITVAGVEYPFSVTLISENAASTASAGSETTKMSGKEWVATLEYEEPKLVAWNDETGTKEVIEAGGKYVMQQGDVLGVYHPEEFYVFTVSPVDFAGSLTDLYKVTVMDYQLPIESQDINLEVEVMDNNNEFIKFNYVVTTP